MCFRATIPKTSVNEIASSPGFGLFGVVCSSRFPLPARLGAGKEQLFYNMKLSKNQDLKRLMAALDSGGELQN